MHAPVDPPHVPVRLVSWNIHKGVGGVDRRYQLERTVRVLQGLSPDILMLQEVAADMPRTRFHDQLEQLRGRLPLAHAAYAAEHRFRTGGYGNALLSRWPLSDVVRIDLTVGKLKQRGALHARVKLPTGAGTRSLIVVNVHLGLSGREREVQLARLATHDLVSRHRASTPLVLGGDLNDVWGNLGARFLEPHRFVRAVGLTKTFPAWLPARPLDAIYVRGPLEVRDGGTVRRGLTAQASDHLPLVTVLAL